MEKYPEKMNPETGFIEEINIGKELRAAKISKDNKDNKDKKDESK